MKKLKPSLIRIGIVILISCQVAIAQNRRAASWQTTDGTIYRGYVAPLPTVLKTQEELFFYQKEEEGKVEIPLTDDLEWLMVNNDTIVRRHEHQSRSVLMQLLYQGPIQLYRVVQTYQHDQYYLVRNGEWHALNNAHAQTTRFKVMPQYCKEVRIPHRVSNDWDAIGLAEELNACLGGTSHYAVSRRGLRPNRVGIGYDLLSTEIIGRWGGKVLGTRRYLYGPESFYPLNRSQPFYQQVLSGQYEGQTFRFFPCLTHNIDLSYVSMNERTASSTTNIKAGVPVEEHIRIYALLLSPGFAISTSFRRRVQFYFGGGGIFILPFYARRTVTLTDPNQSIPSYPVSSTYRRLLVEEPAIYLQLGLQVQITTEAEIGLRGQLGYFLHRYRYYDHQNVLYSEAFPQSTILASNHRSQIQLRLMYRW